MAKKIYPEDLSDKELRDLLMNKRRVERHKRMDAFKKSGRVVELSQSRQFLSMDGIEKEPEDEKDDPLRVTRRRQYRAITNNILLFVEVVAVIALVVILIRGANIVSGLAQEAVSAVLDQPTMTATPLIMEVVLPAGHYPPDVAGGASRFNDSEIPEHLRQLIPLMAEVPVPTPGPETPLRISIPAINVDAPILIGDDEEVLKAGVGWHIGSALPGQNGNLFLSAHNDVWGQIFRHLDQLAPGDEVIVTTSRRSYVYAVTKTIVVEPSYVQALADTPNATISLLSCYPYMVDDQRIIVKGVLQE